MAEPQLSRGRTVQPLAAAWSAAEARHAARLDRFARLWENCPPRRCTGPDLRIHRWPRANPRLIVLMASLVVVVCAAYLIRQRASDDTVDAFRWVAHSHEVRATLFELTAALSDMQAAAFAARLAADRPEVSARYRGARTRYAPILDRLRNLTRDSAEQQERIGMLRARIEERITLFDHAMTGGGASIGSDLAAAVARFPIEDLNGQILAREEQLVQQRQATADRSIRDGAWVTLGATIAQLLLLGAVIWVSERQLARRLSAETAARVAVGRARMIVETVREPIAVIAPDLEILQANRAFADFYGLERPVVGNLQGIPAWKDAALHQRLRDVSATQRELWDCETVQEAAGVTRNVLVNARPMTLPDLAEASVLLTVSDLTARKRYEEQVLELNRQLSGKVEQVTEVNRELEAFSYSVSHDLRAPLRHIAGFSEKLQATLQPGDEKAAHYCEVIADSARRMSELIEDLLNYSRLGRHALRMHAVDMQSLVEEVRSTLMSGVSDRVIGWRVAPLPVVVADPSMLRLVWQNLLENAIKYTAGRPEALIEVGCEERATERVFWIRDNGAGFDMKYSDKLFGVFQRLHKATDFEGTGIGLASVRRIIARHDGRTWAEGVADGGATFHFSLPRHEVARRAEPVPIGRSST